jgi:hypothetical protein
MDIKKTKNYNQQILAIINILAILMCIVFIMVGCSQNDTTMKSVYVDFTNDNGSNKEGIPVDSTVSYFPDVLFTDTVLCWVNSSGHVIDARYRSKEEEILIYGGSLTEFRDTFKIESDSSHFRTVSYMLFKMKEPVLSNHFLGKNIYRLVVLRSFDLPLVIRVENKNNRTTIVSKKLNRHITYPFFVLGDFIMFDPPGKKTVRQKRELEKQYKIAKIENDSLKAIYNNTNYYSTLNNNQEIQSSVWDSLEIQIDSVQFWNTKPELYLNSIQIDGSMWILEGHSQSGYQIKRIPSPHFSPSKYPHEYDKNSYYVNLFRFLIETSGLKNENLY